MNIIKKLLEKVDVLYDDKKWGKRIDPDEWNANFKVLEEGHNKLVDSLTEQISDIDVAIEAVTEEGGKNIKLQYRNNTETLNTAVGHIVSDIDNRYTKLESDTLLAEGTNPLIKDVSYESNTGVFTITKKDGSKVVIDTVIEKVPASMALKEEADGSVWLVVTNQDGSVTKTNVTSLIEDTVITDSDTVVVSSSTDAVNRVTTYTLNIKPNSLGLNHFNSELVTKFEETQNAKTAAVEAKNSAESYAAQAKQSAQSAGTSANAAGSYATNAANSAESAKTSEINASNSATEAAKSAIEAKKYAGTGNTEALVKHIEDKNNPHQVTKEQLGFYISDGEPTGAEAGDVWLDTSLNATGESGGSSSGSGGSSSGSVKQEPLVVEFTLKKVNGQQIFIPNKSISEVQAAHNSGRDVVGRYQMLWIHSDNPFDELFSGTAFLIDDGYVCAFYFEATKDSALDPKAGSMGWYCSGYSNELQVITPTP